MSIKTDRSMSFTDRIHPLLISTLFFIMGIIAAAHTLSFVALSFLVVSALGITLLFNQNGKRGALYLAFVIMLPFTIGFCRYTHVTHSYFTVKQLITDRSFDCTGWVSENSSQLDQKRFKHKLTVTLTSITLPDKTVVKTPYTLTFYLLQKPLCKPGDTLSIKNITIQAPKLKFEHYLLKESSLGTLFLPNIDYTCLSTAPYSFARISADNKQRVSTALTYKLNKLTHTLFCTIFLGTKPSNTLYLTSVKELFSYWGIIHYLARSGLHVALIVMIWSLLLCWLPLPYYFKQLLLMSLIGLYTILTWSSISFIRAFVTFLLYKFCIFHSRPSHAVHILTLTTLGILTANPLQLFFLDFQLSFALTFALAWFNEIKIYYKNSKTIEATT
ncbi:ComEC/Rec2 family competence protein [Candidatus Dependentiae bacterium]|nr:ComEC/Rec2 family competence protein [Candidatus Dependentiae bacterium]